MIRCPKKRNRNGGRWWGGHIHPNPTNPIQATTPVREPVVSGHTHDEYTRAWIGSRHHHHHHHHGCIQSVTGASPTVPCVRARHNYCPPSRFPPYPALTCVRQQGKPLTHRPSRDRSPAPAVANRLGKQEADGENLLSCIVHISVYTPLISCSSNINLHIR